MKVGDVVKVGGYSAYKNMVGVIVKVHSPDYIYVHFKDTGDTCSFRDKELKVVTDATH